MRQYKTMTNLAVEILKDEIIYGNLEPNEMLVPQNLEKRFGLGKMAFREAIRETVGAGLVKSIANKGYFVSAPPSLKEITEIFKIRLMIEKQVATEAAAHISEEDIEKMTVLNHEMKSNKDRFNKFFNLNKEFHMTLYQASGWECLCHLISQLIETVYIYRFKNNVQEKVAGFIRDHGKILDALKLHKVNEVGELVEKNITHGFENICKNKN